MNVVIFYPRQEIKKELARFSRNAYSLSPSEFQGLAPSCQNQSNIRKAETKETEPSSFVNI